MTVFDLIFLAAVLTSAITLITAAISASRGRGGKALRILRIYGVCVGGYLAISLKVAFLRPQRVLSTVDPWCMDDWCLQIEHLDSAPVGSRVSYNIKFRIYGTARRVSQRADGARIYLIDEQGRRDLPNPDPSATPLTVELGPLQSVTTSRVFGVPSGVRKLGLIAGHGGTYCNPMSLLVTGEGGCLFKRPTMIRLR
jgi:hypothetical protein